MRIVLGVAAVLLASQASGLSAQHGVSFHARGFADFNYIESEREIAQGFRSGQIVAHVTSGLSRRLALFSEVSATPGSTGFSLEVERLILRFDQSDYFKVGAGRFHAPISYWYIAYHHGQWLQPTLSRPDMVRPGSGFMPMHFVGVMAEGALLQEPFGLRYAVGAGNGRHTRISRGGDAGDANDSRALLAHTSVTIPFPVGIQFGGAYYLDRATPSETVDADERTVSAFIASQRETPEVVLEYARITHESRGVSVFPKSSSESAYALFAWRLPGVAEAFKPYVRFDRTRVPSADSVFAPLEMNYSGRTFGLRYDLANAVALKLEYRSERVQGSRPMGTFAMQLSFTFPGTGDDPLTVADHEHESGDPLPDHRR